MKLTIFLIIVLAILSAVAWYLFDYQNNQEIETPQIKETPEPIKSEYTICQFNKCVDFNPDEFGYDEAVSKMFNNNCWFVKGTNFCGDFNITKN